MNSHNTSALLEARNLTVSFGDNEVVHGIDFSIQPGEVVALVGESGSGKSVSAMECDAPIARATSSLSRWTISLAWA